MPALKPKTRWLRPWKWHFGPLYFPEPTAWNPRTGGSGLI